MIQRHPMYSILVATLLALAAGCLTREEKITVSRDGTVKYAVKLTGEPNDFDTLAYLPNRQGGWPITETVTEKDDGTEVRREAKRTFAPGEPLPEDFVSEADRVIGEPLRFPTSVEFRQDGDTTVCTFRRNYVGRAWNDVQYWNDRYLDTKRIRELGEKPKEELTSAERREIMRAFADAESHKQLAIVDRASGLTDLQIPTAARLHARNVLLDTYGDDVASRILGDCEGLSDDERDACVHERGERVIDDAMVNHTDALADALNWNPRQRSQWQDALDRATMTYRITNQLGSHHFDIVVDLPGDLVGGNAQETTSNDGRTAFHWEFSGDAVRDRNHELVAVTRWNTATDNAGDESEQGR